MALFDMVMEAMTPQTYAEFDGLAAMESDIDVGMFQSFRDACGVKAQIANSDGHATKMMNAMEALSLLADHADLARQLSAGPTAIKGGEFEAAFEAFNAGLVQEYPQELKEQRLTEAREAALEGFTPEMEAAVLGGLSYEELEAAVAALGN